MASKKPKMDHAVQLAKRRMKRSRLSVLLGFVPESVGQGRAVLRMDVRERHRQIHDVVHGGVLAALADTAAAVAAYTAVPEGAEIATIELKINYLIPIPKGRIRAEATVLHAGRNFVVTECEIRTEEGTLAAKALLTFGAASGYSLQRG